MTVREWLEREVERRGKAGTTNLTLTPGDVERMKRECDPAEVDAAINRAIKEFHEAIDADIRWIDATIDDLVGMNKE